MIPIHERWFGILAAVALAACNHGTRPPTVACTGTNLMANEASNYAFSSQFTFPLISVAPKTDLTFDWSGVTADFLGRAIDTKQDLNTLVVIHWKRSLPEVQTKLNTDSIRSGDIASLPRTFATDGSSTSAKLLAFTNTGNPDPATILFYMDADAYPPSQNTYTLMAATGANIGEGTRMIQAFQLDKNSTNDTVKVTSDSTKLTYTVDLHSLTATGIPARLAAVTLDWSALTRNALGNEFVASDITRAVIGHFTQNPTELEANFIDLERIATKLYAGDVSSSTSVDFIKLTTSAGEGFAGIDGSGTWLMALQCGGCRNPAPWYLTILKPCS